MIFVVRQPEGHEIGIYAERLVVEITGAGVYRFVSGDNYLLELPSNKVEHVRLVESLAREPQFREPGTGLNEKRLTPILALSSRRAICRP